MAPEIDLSQNEKDERKKVAFREIFKIVFDKKLK